ARQRGRGGEDRRHAHAAAETRGAWTAPDSLGDVVQRGALIDFTGHMSSDDTELLRSMGYAQELLRRMTAFSNFAISFSIICILAGGITSLQLGVSAVGGAAAGIVWPLGVAFSLVVALCMAQVASAFPTAGGLYHWSSILGGRGWGWATAWLNLGGLVFVLAAINVGTYLFTAKALGSSFGFQLSEVQPSTQIWIQLVALVAITGSQA